MMCVYQIKGGRMLDKSACETMNLYKNRYIIAVYDEKGEKILGVFDNPKQLNSFLGTKYAGSIISNYIKTFGTFPIIKCDKYNFYFIDIFEEHKDVFEQEDNLFLKFYKENKKQSIDEYCKENNIGRRDYFYKQKLFNNINKGESNEQVECQSR